MQREHNGGPLTRALLLRALGGGSYRGGQTQRRCGICGFRVTYSGIANLLVAVARVSPTKARESRGSKR